MATRCFEEVDEVEEEEDAAEIGGGRYEVNRIGGVRDCGTGGGGMSQESTARICLLAQEDPMRNDKPRTKVRLLLDIIRHILTASRKCRRHSLAMPLLSQPLRGLGGDPRLAQLRWQTFLSGRLFDIHRLGLGLRERSALALRERVVAAREDVLVGRDEEREEHAEKGEKGGEAVGEGERGWAFSARVSLRPSRATRVSRPLSHVIASIVRGAQRPCGPPKRAIERAGI